MAHEGVGGLAARASARVVDGVELVLFPGTEPLQNYGVTDPADIAWMKERLTPHPSACFEQPLRLTNEEALWAIPQSQIVCTDAGRPGIPSGWPARKAGCGTSTPATT